MNNSSKFLINDRLHNTDSASLGADKVNKLLVSESQKDAAKIMETDGGSKVNAKPVFNNFKMTANTVNKDRIDFGELG